MRTIVDMRWRSGAVLLVAAALAGSGSLASATQGGPPGTNAPSMAELLRHVGRDPYTGMPAPINERFIAEHEIAVERYGKDEQPPEPPPPAASLDIRALIVPRLGLAAPVARFGLDRFGRLDVPQDSTTVGWNPAYSTMPGQDGATFMAAHFQYGGVPGVFNRLAAMQPGDEVGLELSDGSRHRYRVTSTSDYALGAIDMGAILRGREGVESLTLMTCSGPADGGEFPLRTVVLAERIAP